MKYYKEITLKNGAPCIIRSCTAEDGEEVLANFIKTHSETDYLTTYPEECTMTAEDESRFLAKKDESKTDVELCAVVGGRIVGTAGIDGVSAKRKLRHRADFGISVEKEFCGLGIGRAMTEACIEEAKKNYLQLELEVVSDNEKALSLYKSVGFTEYGRNPKGFLSKNGFQEVVLMRLELQNL